MARKKEADPQSFRSLRDGGAEIWGIVFLALAALSLISLISHLTHGAANILGKYVGTYLAEGLIAFFGHIAAFAFPLLVGLLGVSRLMATPCDKRAGLLGLLFTLEVCVFLAISNQPIRALTPNLAGKIAAYFLQKIFGLNPFGPYFVTLICVLITAVAGFNVNVGRYAGFLFDKLRSWLGALFRSAAAAPATVRVGNETEAAAAPEKTPEPTPRRQRKSAAADENVSGQEGNGAAEPQRPLTPEEEAALLLEKQMAEFRARKSKPITITTVEPAPEAEEPEAEPAEAESAALARAAAEIQQEETKTNEEPLAQGESSSDAQVLPPTDALSAEAPDDYYKVPQEDEKKRKAPKPATPYILPSMEILPEPPPYSAFINKEEIEKNSMTLEKTLLNFGLEGKVVNVSPGPIITRYEIELAPGIKVSRVVNLQDDISLAVGGQKIRIQAPIPGKAAIGIELPNENRQVVHFKHILASEAFVKTKAKIPVVLGRSISGAPFVCDIAKMPHVLIAGQTGSGKSVCINAFICSMLMTKTPEELRLIMVDPKKVELSYFAGIPHLMAPVVTETKEAVQALRWGQDEMERRYRLFAKVGARNIESFNNKVAAGGIKPGAISDDDNKPLPFLVIIVDELADLMITAPKDVEASIQRIAQMARAVGIHLIVATQRPSVDIITGRIKANLTSRIAFRTIQATDSRTILEHPGSEKLLGMGDMLFLRSGAPDIERCHGAFISEEDVERIVAEIKNQNYEVDRLDGFEAGEEEEEADFADDINGGGRDPLFADAAEIVVSIGQGSTSLLQRRMKIGFARAGRLMDQLERAGIVGPSEGSKAREVLVKPNDLDDLLQRLQ